VLVRLNNGYGSTGTIPLPNDYQRFAADCATFAATSQGATHWIIGNEPNLAGERPQGIFITPQDYARCFTLCRNAIKQASPLAQVMTAAMAPYNADPMPWHVYLQSVLHNIAPTGCDGVTVHAYARGMDPANISSTEEMGGVLAGTYSGFRSYQDAIAQIPPSLLNKPVFITEFDAYGAWENKDTGVILAAYTEIDQWNRHASPDTPRIFSLICFRWLGPPDVENAMDWEMRNKPELLKDFQRAAAANYRTPTVADVVPGGTIFIPSVEKGGSPMPTRTIDPRLTARGTRIEDGMPDPILGIWRLIGAKFFDHNEAGGRHHVYVETLGSDGQPVSNVPFTVHYSTGNGKGITNGKLGFDAGNVPFSEGRNAFDVFLGTPESPLPSDKVLGIGMGEDDPGGWNAGEHTATLLTYQRVPPAKATPPSSPPPVTATTVPILAHPVGDPRYRTITQRFGADPEYYSQFKIDGVPLKGHEGMDFGAPNGTPVVAVDVGQATEVGNQGDVGYGKYIKLVHPWGETVYAHLSEAYITQGVYAKRGQVIGLSGWTGNVDPKGPAGAHLHFGLRVKPYNRQDGWGGYSDPAPYLQNTYAPTPPPTQPPPTADRQEIRRIILAAAGEFRVDWRLLLSLIHAESSGNPLSHNHDSGAKGLGQLTPGTWEDVSKAVGAHDIFDAQDNARATAYYLNWCIEQVGGSIRKALWAYVWGVGNVQNVPDKVPQDVIEYATKIIHGAEVLSWINP
jgi:murein DD-endopeptidase MepM/ murein hydrolase activator NlpD